MADDGCIYVRPWLAWAHAPVHVGHRHHATGRGAHRHDQSNHADVADLLCVEAQSCLEVLGGAWRVSGRALGRLPADQAGQRREPARAIAAQHRRGGMVVCGRIDKAQARTLPRVGHVSSARPPVARAPAMLSAVFICWMAGILILFYAVKEQKPVRDGDVALIGQALGAFTQAPSLIGTLESVLNLLAATSIILFAGLIGFRLNPHPYPAGKPRAARLEFWLLA